MRRSASTDAAISDPAGDDKLAVVPSALDLDCLYKSYGRELCGYLRQRFGAGPPEPEDIAQASFARLATALTSEIDHPRSFLYATARNLVSDYRRRQCHRNSHVDDMLHIAQHTMLDEITPERVLLDRERVRILSDALASLPERQRNIFLLSRLDGLPYAEIATRVGISASNVQKLVQRALAKCSRHMNETETCAPTASATTTRNSNNYGALAS